jgi:ABC-type multidrug transport system permease subunit
MRNLRSLFYGSLFLLILTMGFVLVYFFVLSTTASGEQARDFVVFAGILVAPIVFVPLYWGYRSEYRPHRMTPEENKALSRGSALFAASSLALILGLSAWRKDSMSVSVVALAIYGALTAYYVRLLWRMHREK